MKSWSARCLAVRRVTQDNQGKKTAGVDGKKALTPKQRLTLVANLKLSPKVAPTRRVWIPKPGTDNGRLLGFKTIITPSKEKQKVHYDRVASIINAHQSAPQSALVRNLNPVIRGWANYYSTVVSKDAYARQDYLMYQKLSLGKTPPSQKVRSLDN